MFLKIKKKKINLCKWKWNLTKQFEETKTNGKKLSQKHIHIDTPRGIELALCQCVVPIYDTDLLQVRVIIAEKIIEQPLRHRFCLLTSRCLHLLALSLSAMAVTMWMITQPRFPTSSFHISVRSPIWCCYASQSPSEVAVVNGNPGSRISERGVIRLGLPSKGRMAEDTLELLKVPLILSSCVGLLISFWE